MVLNDVVLNTFGLVVFLPGPMRARYFKYLLACLREYTSTSNIPLSS